MRCAGSPVTSACISMEGLAKFDHTHAILAGFTSIWQRMFLFCACGVMGQFIGGNIYNAPSFISDFMTNGPSALGDLRPMDLAWLPLEWAGALIISAFHLSTLLYLPVLMLAFLSLMRDDEIKLWPLAVLLIGQPIDAWLVREPFDHRLSGTDFAISLSLLLVYSALAIGGFYTWWRVREDHEE